MTSAVLEIMDADIPFDTIRKEPRQSVGDSRALIWIDVDAVGSGYRAIINGNEFQLPDGLATIEDAKKVAVEIAMREMTVAICELVKMVY